MPTTTPTLADAGAALHERRALDLLAAARSAHDLDAFAGAAPTPEEADFAAARELLDGLAAACPRGEGRGLLRDAAGLVARAAGAACGGPGPEDAPTAPPGGDSPPPALWGRLLDALDDVLRAEASPGARRRLRDAEDPAVAARLAAAGDGGLPA